MNVTTKDIKVLDDPNAVCWMIRCQQTEEETEGDLQEIMASIRAGYLEEAWYDAETGELVEGEKMTDDQLRRAAEEYISDYGRDGWDVSWAFFEDPADLSSHHMFVQNREDATKFLSLYDALNAARMLKTKDHIEVWGMV